MKEEISGKIENVVTRWNALTLEMKLKFNINQVIEVVGHREHGLAVIWENLEVSKDKLNPNKENGISWRNNHASEEETLVRHFILRKLGGILWNESKRNKSLGLIQT